MMMTFQAQSGENQMLNQPIQNSQIIQQQQKLKDQFANEDDEYAAPSLDLKSHIGDQKISIFLMLTHAKWQVRRIAYLDIQDYLTQKTDIKELSESNATSETLAPWMKNIVNDANLFVLQEGLKTLQVFTETQQLNNNIISYYLGDLVERASNLKPQMQKLAITIIINSLEASEGNYALSEITKRVDSKKNPKIVIFALQVIQKIFSNYTGLTPEVMRLLFQVNLGVLKHTGQEIRSVGIENLAIIYQSAIESIEEIKRALLLKSVRSVHIKEIESAFMKHPKRSDQELFKLIPEDVQKDIALTKINKQVIESGAKIDLHTILPDKFFDLPYIPQQRERRNRLEQFAQNLEKLVEVGAELNRAKDYGNIYTILLSCSEESNFLIYTESMRCFSLLMKIFKNCFNFQIVKHFLTAAVEKYKGPKANSYNQNIDSVLEDCFRNRCFPQDQFFEFLLSCCENERNLNMRIGCISWISNNVQIIYSQISDEKYSQKLFSSMINRISAILKQETNLRLKEVCLALLNNVSSTTNQPLPQILDGLTNYGKYFNTINFENNNNNNKENLQFGGNLSQQQQQQQQQQSNRPATAMTGSAATAFNKRGNSVNASMINELGLNQANQQQQFEQIDLLTADIPEGTFNPGQQITNNVNTTHTCNENPLSEGDLTPPPKVIGQQNARLRAKSSTESKRRLLMQQNNQILVQNQEQDDSIEFYNNNQMASQNEQAFNEGNHHHNSGSMSNGLSSNSQPQTDIMHFQKQNFNLQSDITDFTVEEQQLAEQISKELLQVRKLAVQQSEQQLNSFAEDFLGWLDSINANSIQQLQEHIFLQISNLSEYISNKRNPNNNVVIKSYIQDKTADFILNLIVKVNKICLSLSLKSLYRQIKAMTITLGHCFSSNTKRLTHLFDSAYFSCNIENFLKVVTRLVQKGDQQISDKPFQQYTMWLAVKLDKSQNYLIDRRLLSASEKVLNKCCQSQIGLLEGVQVPIDNIFKTLLEAIKRKMQLLQETSSLSPLVTVAQISDCSGGSKKKHSNSKSFSVSISGLSFETPKSKRSKASEGDITVNRTDAENLSASNINNNENIIKIIEEDLDNNYTLGIEKLRSYLNGSKQNALRKSFNQYSSVQQQQLQASHSLYQLTQLQQQQTIHFSQLQQQFHQSQVNPNQGTVQSPTQSFLSPGTSKSPGRPWRRGIGRERDASTPLKNITTHVNNNNNNTSMQFQQQQQQEISSSSSQPSPNLGSTADIKMLIEKICLNVNDKTFGEASLALIDLKAHFPNQMEFLLFNVFTHICRMIIFENINLKKQLEFLHQNLMKCVLRQSILYAYKQAFNYSLKQFDSLSCHMIIKNAFTFIIYQILEDNISLHDLSYFVETIMFCLSERNIKVMGEEIMHKLYLSHSADDVRRCFEQQLVNSMKYYQIFVDWQQQNMLIISKSSADLNRIKTTQSEQYQTVVTENSASQIQIQQNNYITASQESQQQQLDNLLPNQIRLQQQPSFGGKNLLDEYNPNNQNNNNQQQYTNISPVTRYTTINSPDTVHTIQDLTKGFTNEQVKPINLIQVIDENQNQPDLQCSQQLIQKDDQMPTDQSYQVSSSINTNNGTFCNMTRATRDINPMSINATNIASLNNVNFQQNENEWLQKYKEEKGRHLATKEMLDRVNQEYQQQIMEKEILKQQLQKQCQMNLSTQEYNSSIVASTVQTNQSQMSNVQKLQMQENFNKSSTITSCASYYEDENSTSQTNRNCQSSKLTQLQIVEEEDQKEEAYSNKKQIVNAKSPLELVPMKTRERAECVKQLQEILLTSDQLYNDIGEALLTHYEGLEDTMEKIDFVIDLKMVLLNQTLLENMSENNYRILLMITFRLCTSGSTQKEIFQDKEQRILLQTDLTKELQIILDQLLCSKPLSFIIVICLRLLNEFVPSDMTKLLTKSQKMLYILILKCLERMLATVKNQDDIKVFEILIELYKFFKVHPPENLIEGLPSLKDLELIFRSLKNFSDQIIEVNPKICQQFVQFLTSEFNKNIYLQYVSNVVKKLI